MPPRHQVILRFCQVENTELQSLTQRGYRALQQNQGKGKVIICKLIYHWALGAVLSHSHLMLNLESVKNY